STSAIFQSFPIKSLLSLSPFSHRFDPPFLRFPLVPQTMSEDFLVDHWFQCCCILCAVCIEADSPGSTGTRSQSSGWCQCSRKSGGCFRCLEDITDCFRSCFCPGSIRSRAQARALARARADARSRPAAHPRPHTRHHDSDSEATAPLVSSPPSRVHMTLPSPSPSPPPRTTTESELPPPPAYTPPLKLTPAESHPTSGSVSESAPLPSVSGRASEPVQVPVSSAPSAKDSGNLPCWVVWVEVGWCTLCREQGRVRGVFKRVERCSNLKQNTNAEIGNRT
ncbi:hypothetical protein R3P38DRAFT_3592615, partial [Favolaschia claudopus]